MKKIIGFIGSGNMAEAIMSGIIGTGLCTGEAIIASDKSPERMEYLARKIGIRTTQSNKDVFDKSDIIILSIKPQNMKEALEDIKPSPETRGKKIIISIAAGIMISFMEDMLYSSIGKESRHLLPIARVMPNTPGLAGSGMTGICFNDLMEDEDSETVKSIFASMGKILICREDEMDAVTAMSGSGPAYVFYFMESMIAAGRKLGFSDESSILLTMETIKGAVRLMETQEETPEALRRKVTSPGGTTEAAIKMMEASGVMDGIIKGIISASERSRELSFILCDKNH